MKKIREFKKKYHQLKTSRRSIIGIQNSI